MQKIFEVLSSLEALQFYEGGGYLQSLANFSAKDEKLHNAIDTLRVNSISQIPVFDSSRVVGT